MDSFFAFLRITILLLIEGAAIAVFMLPSGSWLLPVALGLPVAAFVNVLVVFLLTILGIPLSQITLLGVHLLLTAGIIILVVRKDRWVMDVDRTKEKVMPRMQKMLFGASLLLIAINLVYSFSHAVLLPTVQYDSATNWTMRSQISFYDRSIAFDPTEIRGMAKPQYPFLFHALQITANQGQDAWNDTAANAILYILSLGTFGALFLMIKRLRGGTHAAATVAAIVSIPLFGLHLAQGYGDLNLAQYLLLSLCSLGLWLQAPKGKNWKWLLLSAMFVTACVWTKSEGVLFGLAPWILILALVVFRSRSLRKPMKWPIISAITLAAPWPIFAWAKGLSLTPHSSDTMIGLRSEGVQEAFLGLFSRGSFGIVWYALALLIPVLLVAFKRRDQHSERSLSPTLLWGLILFIEVLFIYLMTPNVRFLLNAESYYRQMMIPAAMLILAISLCFQNKEAKETKE